MWFSRFAPIWLPAIFVGLTNLAFAQGDLTRYSELLESVRAGVDEDLAEFTRLGDTLALELKRDDIRAVTEYYASLSSAERVQGLRDFEAFSDIWKRLIELEQSGVMGHEWRESRRTILVELRTLAERVEARADFVPAARALSLSARIETQILVLAHLDDSLHDTRGHFDNARSDARTSIELFKRSGQLRPQLEPLWTLARLERVRPDPATSYKLFTECLELARLVADTTYQEHALQGLVSLAHGDGNLLELDRLLYELAELKQPSENWPLTWRQAERLIHQDYPERALEFLERNPPRTPSNRRVWHQLRANAFTRLADWDAARRATESSGNDPLRLALIDLGRGAPDAALARLEGAQLDLNDPKRALLLHSTRGEAFLELDQLSEALFELQAARTLSLQLETRLALEDGEAEGRSNIVGEVMGVHGIALLAEALARDGRILEAAQVIEEAQAQRLRPDDSAIDIRAWAGHFEAGLVTWVVGPDRSLRVSLPADCAKPTYAVLERGRIELTRAVRRLREALCDGREEVALELGRNIVDDLFPALPVGEGRALLLLHGPLEGLPVEWLIETGILKAPWTPIVLPGLPSPAPGTPSDTWSWSLCGSPSSNGLSLLPAALEELTELKALRPAATLRRGEDFDRESFLATLLPGSGVHVATHLVETDDGLRTDSRLMLSNGDSIGAAEIRAAKPALSICVLATCESGGGRFVDAEGAQGLAQAFLGSGTRNLIVTSWPVSDKAGHAFSSAFHRALLDDLAPSRAAAAARARLRELGFPAADWSAFRALGRD